MQLIEAILLPANLPFTGLLSLTIIYWLSVILGALDIEVFEIDLDLDGADGFGASLLSFFKVGSVPISILISLLALFSWVGSVLVNDVFNPSGGLFPGAIFWVPIFIGGAFVTKVAVSPFRGFFKSLQSGGQSYSDYKGKLGKVFTTKLGQGFGQIEIEGEGSPVRLQAILEDENLARGDQVLVVDHDRKKNVYIVVPYDDPSMKTGDE